MNKPGHSPVAWGFGISCGVAMVVLIVFLLLFLLSVAICGGGLGGIISLFYVDPETPVAEPADPQPSIPDNPPQSGHVRPKMRIESTNKDVEPQEVHVLIWSDSPSEGDYHWALDRLAGEEDRKVFFYESSVGMEGEPLSVWMIRDYQFKRLE